jgi:Na+/H+ antiporter NhaD/arsenite permease-like protein
MLHLQQLLSLSTSKPVFYLATVGIVFSALQFWLRPNALQTTSLVIFTALMTGTFYFWRFRLGFAFLGVASLLGSGVIDLQTLLQFAALDLILFLVSMMIVIGYLEEKRVFHLITERILRATPRNAAKLVVILMLTSAMLAALVDEVTSVLFMVATVVHIARKYQVDPAPFVMMTVFATNIGSSATVIGNPVGVLIAFRSGLSFNDFLRWATPISLAGLGLAIIICLRYFSKNIAALAVKMNSVKSVSTVPIQTSDPPLRQMLPPFLLFGGTVAGLLFHKYVEVVLGLAANSMLLGTPLAAAGVVLILNGDNARNLVERRVDWWSLVFFIMLFASVGTLKFVGITDRIASSLAASTGSDPGTSLVTLGVVAGLASASMDNILAVAILVPIVQDLGLLGVYSFPLWWALLFGATFFGNLTLIGSTANIVAVGMLERGQFRSLTFRSWMVPGALVAIPTLALALLLILIQIPLMP